MKKLLFLSFLSLAVSSLDARQETPVQDQVEKDYEQAEKEARERIEKEQEELKKRQAEIENALNGKPLPEPEKQEVKGTSEIEEARKDLEKKMDGKDSGKTEETAKKEEETPIIIDPEDSRKISLLTEGSWKAPYQEDPSNPNVIRPSGGKKDDKSSFWGGSTIGLVAGCAGLLAMFIPGWGLIAALGLGAGMFAAGKFTGQAITKKE